LPQRPLTLTSASWAAVIAVALLTVLYILPQMGLQGVTSSAKLQANAWS
jgi:hypothetical protein